MSETTQTANHAASAVYARAFVLMGHDQRRGQALFNALVEEAPLLAEALRGTSLDPFHHEDRVSRAMGWIQGRIASEASGVPKARPVPDLETFTIDDRPDGDIESVVNLQPVSNDLVLYVRGYMAQWRRDREMIFGPQAYEREDIAAQVFDACDLVQYSEPNSYFGAAWSICAAAGWDHLAGSA